MKLAEAASAIRESVLPPDPGSLRGLAALRATLAGLLSLLLVILLGGFVAVPSSERILGFAIGLFAGATVRDPTRRKQATTMALVPVAAFLAAALASVLLDRTWAPCLLIALIAFAATYGAQRGPRWGSLGMIALIACVIALATKLPPSLLPLRLLVICMSAASAALIRFALLPERPQAELRRLRRDIRRGLSRVIGEIARALAAGGWTDRARRRLRSRQDRLASMMLMALTRIWAMSPRPPGLGLHLLDVQLAAERVARLARHDLGPPAERPALIRAATTLQSALTADRVPPKLAEAPTPLGHALVLLASLIGRSGEGAAPAPPPAPPAATGLRPAAQAAIAVLLAAGFGQLVSPRWYWAAFAAFVVFQGTRSRGESIRKVVQFMAGTVAGVAAGVVIAGLLSGHEMATMALIIVAVFFAFYAFQAAYGVMVFWITIILGLMFGLIGYFPEALLVLRLKETAVGAACGALVACAVMVRPHRAVIEATFAALLRAIDDVVQAASRSLLDTAPDPRLASALVALESGFLDLEQAVQPELAGLGAARHTGLRRRMVILTGCESWASEIGRIGLHAPGPIDEGMGGMVRDAAAQIADMVARLTGRTTTSEAPGPAVELPPPTEHDSAGLRAVRLMVRIDLALAHLAAIRD